MKKKRLFFCLVFFGLVFFFFGGNNGDESLKDNYYQAINEKVFAENELSNDEYNWSYFTVSQEVVDNDTSLVVQDILSGNVEVLNDKEINTIRNVYDKALDREKRNNDGIGALTPYLDKVWNVSTVNELVDVIILIEQELGIGLLTNIEVVQDYMDNDKNIIYFYPVTYAFGASSDYIVNDDYMAYKAYIRRACVQLWKVYGLETKEARETVDRVFTFYEGVSSNSKLSDELGNVSDYYNRVLAQDVNSIFSNVDKEYLSRRGIGNEDFYSLVDRDQYQYLNDSLTMDNLEVWKEVIITKILSSYAGYGSDDYIEVYDNLNESLLGSNEVETNEEKAENVVVNLFSSEIDEAYENKYLGAKQIEEIEKMFVEIKEAFRVRFNNNEWISDEARDKALVKLDKMEIIIGLGEVDGYRVADGLKISDSSLISDVIRVQQLIIQDDLERLNNGEKRNLIQQNVVNAYYQPLDNSIVIPVAFFELVNEEADYYEKLGTLGMILAHEVTHAFDGNGSQFDEDGNLNDWWSEEDKRVFENLKQEVINYYSKYEVLDGKYIDGDKTVNENIADLGAVACIVDIANARNATLGDMKLMFSSYANIWASIESEEYMELLLLQDVHAPNQFRVNAVLSSTEEFYRVYNIYPWDDMWIAKEDRILVW